MPGPARGSFWKCPTPSALQGIMLLQSVRWLVTVSLVTRQGLGQHECKKGSRGPCRCCCLGGVLGLGWVWSSLHRVPNTVLQVLSGSFDESHPELLSRKRLCYLR